MEQPTPTNWGIYQSDISESDIRSREDFLNVYPWAIILVPPGEVDGMTMVTYIATESIYDEDDEALDENNLPYDLCLDSRGNQGQRFDHFARHYLAHQMIGWVSGALVPAFFKGAEPQ